ncbi:MAG: STAS domain-containing protein, partial [Acidobacteriota bacterium]
GELTLASGDEMLREASDTLVASGRTRILLNLSRLEFMDSAGLGELVSSHRMVQRFEGQLKILHAPPRIYSSLTIAKLLPIFEIFDDEAEAIASFGKQG